MSIERGDYCIRDCVTGMGSLNGWVMMAGFCVILF